MGRIAIVVVLLAAVVGGMSRFGCGPVVLNPEGEQRIALLLGDPVSVITEAGLHLTAPFVSVQTYDGRWRHLGSLAREIPTSDQERIVVDYYVIWRITDPLAFRRAFPTGATEAEKQISQRVRGQVREVIGRKTLVQVLKDERAAIMQEITESSGEAVEPFGVVIQDVRIPRTELPKGAEENVYARMRAERNRLARKYRAEGQEEARRLRAEADRDAVVTVAEARRDAERRRGEGDARAAGIYAASYRADPDFYDFVRSLEAYRKTLGSGTTMVLPPDHAFFRQLQEGGARAAGAERSRARAAGPGRSGAPGRGDAGEDDAAGARPADGAGSDEAGGAEADAP